MQDLFNWPRGVKTRSISFENPTGKAGEGGRAASPLGVGRKGDPVKHLQAGESLCLADIAGPGVIRHLWLTTHQHMELMRGLVIRCYWEKQTKPSVEVPLGDFFGFAHGGTPAYQSALHSVSEKLGLNSWLQMPFRKHARIELSNESNRRAPIFYQIDYTLGDALSDDTALLHAYFKRESPTTLGEDFVLLDRRQCRGRYLGAVMGVIPSDPRWWGEGEFKVFLDGDSDFPTIVGTGTEDYVGLSWGIQQNTFLYHGANWRQKNDIADTGAVSMYRWHLVDPIYWEKQARITLQQIGHAPTGEARTIEAYKQELYERADDWSAAVFWYEPPGGDPLPTLPGYDQRCAGLTDFFARWP